MCIFAAGDQVKIVGQTSILLESVSVLLGTQPGSPTTVTIGRIGSTVQVRGEELDVDATLAKIEGTDVEVGKTATSVNIGSADDTSVVDLGEYLHALACAIE